MNNFEYTVIFFQISDADNRVRKELDFHGGSNEKRNNASLKYWASSELADYFRVAFENRGRSMRIFNWNKPIYAEVFFTNELVVLFEQLVVTKDRIIKEGFDFPYLLRKRQYILIEKKAIKTGMPTSKEPNKSFEYTDLDKLFNAVEYQTRAKYKFPTPILYTPMK
jgi:hypothetical protein